MLFVIKSKCCLRSCYFRMIPFYAELPNEITSKNTMTKKAKPLGEGSFNCVFKGYWNSDDVVFRLNTDNYTDHIADAIREIVVSNFLRPMKLPSAHTQWIQTRGLITTSLEKLSSILDISPACQKRLENATGLTKRLLLVHEVAGNVTLQEYVKNTPSLKASDVRAIFWDIIWGLYNVSTLYGMTHGDLKFDNIMVGKTRTQDTMHIKRRDGKYDQFSLPKDTPPVTIIDLNSVSMVLTSSRTDFLLGNPLLYSNVGAQTFSFDHLTSKQFIYEATDIFSVGLMLAGVAAKMGQLKISDSTVYNLQSGLPPYRGVGGFFKDAFPKSVPKNRYATMQIVLFIFDIGYESMHFNTRTDLAELVKIAEEYFKNATSDNISGMIRGAIIGGIGDSGLDLIQRMLHPDQSARMSLEFSIPDRTSLKHHYGWNNVMAHQFFANYYDGIVDAAAAETNVTHNIPLSVRVDGAKDRENVIAEVKNMEKYYRDSIISNIPKDSSVIIGDFKSILSSMEVDNPKVKESVVGKIFDNIASFSVAVSKLDLTDAKKEFRDAVFWIIDSNGNPLGLRLKIEKSNAKQQLTSDTWNLPFFSSVDKTSYRTTNLFIIVQHIYYSCLYVFAKTPKERGQIRDTYQKSREILRIANEKNELGQGIMEVKNLL